MKDPSEKSSSQEPENPEEPEMYPAGPIPDCLHSFESGQAFSRCLVCEKDLIEAQRDYTIHKTFQAEEVLLEYAMCRECCDEMSEEFSEASRETMSRLMLDLAGVDTRLQQFTRPAENGEGVGIAPFEDWIGTCALTGKALRDCKQYSLMAICVGDKVVYAGYPMMISDDGEELMTNAISAETRRRMDQFIGQHFTPPGVELNPTAPKPLYLFT